MEPRILPRRPARRSSRSRSSPRPSPGRRSRRCRRRRRRRRRWSAAANCSRSRQRPTTSRSSAELVLAADQFIITPAGRVEEAARARGAGRRRAHGDRRLSLVHRLGPRHDDQPRRADAVDAPVPRGRLHPPHVRATTCATASSRTCFPTAQREGLYHTADATLWFFHAVERYVQATGDTETLQRLLPTFLDIVRSTICAARASASASIRRTACCAQGEEGYQLTWMDAKVDDWVVTPRRGKAVEINALWYNALCLLEAWTQDSSAAAESLDLAEHAPNARTRPSTAVLERRARAISTTSSTASTATIRRAGRTRCSPSRCDHPVLDRDRAGSR